MQSKHFLVSLERPWMSSEVLIFFPLVTDDSTLWKLEKCFKSTKKRATFSVSAAIAGDLEHRRLRASELSKRRNCECRDSQRKAQLQTSRTEKPCR